MRLLHIEVKDLVTLPWSEIQRRCTLFNLSPYDTHAFHVYYKEFHRDLRAKCPNRGSATSLTTIPEEPESSVSGSAADVTKTADSDIFFDASSKIESDSEEKLDFSLQKVDPNVSVEPEPNLSESSNAEKPKIMSIENDFYSEV
jgi:hypothetical protein